MLTHVTDQAASLRQWALEQSRNREDLSIPATEQPVVVPSAEQLLVVAGVPRTGNRIDTVKQRLHGWSEKGARWAVDVSEWEIILLDSGFAAPESKRWALWVGTDIEAFDRCYQALRDLSQQKIPRQVLALHDPGLSRQGLLTNLVSLAQCYFGIELIVLAGDEQHAGAG